MSKELKQLHTHIGRSKIAIFVIVGFLALITYLLISISTQITETTTTLITRRSEAAEQDAPDQPDIAPPPGEGIIIDNKITCDNYRTALINIRYYVDKLCPERGSQTLELGDEMNPDYFGGVSREDVDDYLNGLEDLIEMLCKNCPSYEIDNDFIIGPGADPIEPIQPIVPGE